MENRRFPTERGKDSPFFVRRSIYLFIFLFFVSFTRTAYGGNTTTEVNATYNNNEDSNNKSSATSIERNNTTNVISCIKRARQYFEDTMNLLGSHDDTPELFHHGETKFLKYANSTSVHQNGLEESIESVDDIGCSPAQTDNSLTDNSLTSTLVIQSKIKTAVALLHNAQEKGHRLDNIDNNGTDSILSKEINEALSSLSEAIAMLESLDEGWEVGRGICRNIRKQLRSKRIELRKRMQFYVASAVDTQSAFRQYVISEGQALQKTADLSGLMDLHATVRTALDTCESALSPVIS